MAYLLAEGCLRQGDTVQFWYIIQTTDQNHESRTRTYQQGVGKHAQCLNQALFYRMRHRGSRCHIRGTTLACLIAEQAAFHTVHDGGSQGASYTLFQSKGMRYNHFQHLGNQLVVDDDDHDYQHKVADGHDRHQHRTDVGNTMNTAKHNR